MRDRRDVIRFKMSTLAMSVDCERAPLFFANFPSEEEENSFENNGFCMNEVTWYCFSGKTKINGGNSNFVAPGASIFAGAHGPGKGWEKMGKLWELRGWRFTWRCVRVGSVLS